MLRELDLRLDEKYLPSLIEKSVLNAEDGVCNSPSGVYETISGLYDTEHLPEEHVWLPALDHRMNPLGVFNLSHGTIRTSIANQREIFVRLCLCGASFFILLHNHVSGDVTPSKEDVECTSTIHKASRIINIPMTDHIIFGRGAYYSFREQQGNIFL